MATETPTLTEATEPMETGTPMLIMVSTTERGLLRLSPRPRLRLTPSKVSLGYQRFLWVTKGFFGIPKVSLGYQRFLWVTKGFFGLPKVSLGFQRFLWVSKGFFRFPKVSL